MAPPCKQYVSFDFQKYIVLSLLDSLALRAHRTRSMPWPKFWSPTWNSTSPSDPSLSDTITSQASKLKTATQETATHLQHEASRLTQNPPTTTFLTSLTSAPTLLSTALLTTTILTLLSLQRRYFRRYPTATSLPQSYFLPQTRRFTRSLFGHVTTIGDADNFRLFHTPLGRLALWGLFRRVPNEPKALKNNTIHIRLAGVDAPELSHFGRPAQPWSKEAMEWLTNYLRGRRVRCYVHKADQYQRVVATVYIRKGLLRRDVGLQMLRAGWATMYEAKSGAEFSGEDVEKRYREAEEWAKTRRKGMWADGAGKLESPGEYKKRYREGSANEGG